MGLRYHKQYAIFTLAHVVNTTPWPSLYSVLSRMDNEKERCKLLNFISLFGAPNREVKIKGSAPLLR